MLRRLYDWVLHWAETPYGAWALGILSFAESSFFPIPPDVLLLALGLSIPKRAFWYALICSVASVLGGALGYYIGYELHDFGMKLLKLYGYTDKFETLAGTFRQHNFLAVLIAAITPIPYKVFTITAGYVKADFFTFLLASAIGRSTRFFAEAGILYFFGKPAKKFIDKYFNIISILFLVLLIGSFFLIKFLL